MSARRGGDRRGNARDRRTRRIYLVTHYRANVDLGPDGAAVPLGEGQQACRCYRCGCLLTVITVTVDRIVQGCVKTREYPDGGTYERKNIRPACSFDNSSTGGILGAQRKAAS